MDKPLSFFLANVIKNGSITLEQANTFNQLATPHLQFEAVLALKKARHLPACGEPIFLPQPKTSFMANTRWIEVAVLGLALPLIHAFWVRPPEIKKSVSAFNAVRPAIFVAAPEAIQIPKKHSFHPKNENEALSHFMNEPVPLSQPISSSELTQDKSPTGLSEQAARDAESAALNALPITSRR